MSDLQDRLGAALGSAYVIERELGGGGMSRVFLARETALDRAVVIKVLPPELEGAVSAERFRREIALCARLQHPTIVPLLTAGTAGDLLYYTMPFIEGTSLRAEFERIGALPIDRATEILRDILEALSFAHARGVIHRDVKPENILLAPHHAVVSDFGVAKAIAAAGGTDPGGRTSTGLIIGSPAYMAPEQAAADPAMDHRADLYAVGVVAFEMFAGVGPFPGRTPSQT
ncbi:MAG TPA: serine/threonine-protein kinase, partial [Gemmatimonadaceae bacterium]|nr:serine/threonine-protein kinase [Gemmatimonadaceae bacterium]